MLDEEKTKPKLRYKSGISRDSEYTPIDPNAVGFGDLVSDDSKNKLETTRESLSAANKSLLKNAKKVTERLHRIDYAKLKKQLADTAKKAQQRAGRDQQPADKPVYKYTQTESLSGVKAQPRLKKKQPQREKSKPQISRILSSLRPLLAKINTRVFAAVALAALALIPIARAWPSNTATETTHETAEVSGAFDVADVDIKPVYPAGTNEDDVEPFVDPERGLVSYQTANEFGDFIITQQTLPAEFQEEPDKIKNLALSLNDKETIDRFETNKGLIYVASAADQSQTAIFSHSELLVFVTSPLAIDTDSWIELINSLQ